MKKALIIVLSLLLVCCCVLSACKGSDTGSEAASAEPTSAASEAPSSTPGDDGHAVSSAFTGDTSFDPETDADNLYSTENAILIDAEGGFYWSSSLCPYLLFYDYGLEEALPVCSRPECEHFTDNNAFQQNLDCDAYIGAVRHPALYNGKIYYVDRKGVANPNVDGSLLGMRLFCMNPDGTEKQFIKNLFTPGYGSPQWVILHRGNLYAMSVESDVVDGVASGKTSILVVPLEGDETNFKTIYEVENVGWGCMRFIGDYCCFWIRYDEGYYYINYDTGEIIDERQSVGVAGRWNSKTEELEILYRDLLPESEDFYACAWVETDGTFYVTGSRGLMKIENGELSVVQSFEDPEKRFVPSYISNGIAIAHTVPADLNDPYLDWDFWICRFDGTTVFKGTLPMDWFRECPEFDSLPGDPRFPSVSMVSGDDTGMWCQFAAHWRGTGENDAQAEFLVRYDFTDDGIQTKLYSSFVLMFDPASIPY